METASDQGKGKVLIKSFKRRYSRATTPGFFALRHSEFEYFGENAARTYRNKCFKIAAVNAFGCQSVVRRLRAQQNVADGEIAIDWDAWLTLNGDSTDTKGELKLTIRPVGFVSSMWHAFRSPDPAEMHAFRLGFLGILLGAIGVALGVVALWS